MQPLSERTKGWFIHVGEQSLGHRHDVGQMRLKFEQLFEPGIIRKIKAIPADLNHRFYD